LTKKGLAGIAARAKRLMGGSARMHREADELKTGMACRKTTKKRPLPGPLLKEREMLGGTTPRAEPEIMVGNGVHFEEIDGKMQWIP
jgi:hypothetical protein